MNKKYLDKITQGDCRDHIPHLMDNSIELFLSDIPYGINLDDWDVLHDNTNSALLGHQRVSIVFQRRGLESEAEAWQGWRLGNMAPVYEPIAWFVKPYKIGGTIADNVLDHGVGAMNIEACQIQGTSPTNLLEFGFQKSEQKIHEAQKPLKLIEFLIKLTTREDQVVLDPFMGSGTTAVAAKRLNRHFIGFEIVPAFHQGALERLDSECGTEYTEASEAFQPMLFEKAEDE